MSLEEGSITKCNTTASAPIRKGVLLTELYRAICDRKWDLAIAIAQRSPEEAKTWVIRYDKQTKSDSPEILWRFLPIHSACARNPPVAVISSLIEAYSDGPMCVDDKGVYPLHFACGNRANREVIRSLLTAFPQAAKETDPNGMLPIHYLAGWGPSSIEIIDMLMVSYRESVHVRDENGMRPYDLALAAAYGEMHDVAEALRRWMDYRNNKAPLFLGKARIGKEKETKQKQKQAEQQAEQQVEQQEHSIEDEFSSPEMSPMTTKMSARLSRDVEEVKKALAIMKGEKDEADIRCNKAENECDQMRDERDAANARAINAEEQECDQLVYYRKKVDEMSYRFQTLSASVATMTEMQATLIKKNKVGDELLLRGVTLRRSKILAMIDFENSMMHAQEAGKQSVEYSEKQKIELNIMAGVVETMIQ